MNPGLRLLTLRLARGRVRLIGRRVRTWRGALGIGGTVLFLIGFAALQLWRAADPASRAANPSPESLRTLVPALVTVLTLVSAVSERGLYFTAPEIGFLFPAPVGRRELLVYNLFTRLGVQVLSGIWVSLFSAGYAPLPGAGVAAVMLAFVFMYVAAQALSLGATAAEAYLSPLVRRLVRTALIAAMLLVAGSAAMSAAPGSTGSRFRALLESPAVRALSLPARPLGELFAARTAGAALGWAAASAALVAVAVVLVLSFDVAFTERSLVVGRRAQQRLSRFLATPTPADGVERRAGFRLRSPRLPLPVGARALAWRQTTELLRTPRAMLGPLVFGAVWLVAMFGGMRAGAGDPEASRTSVLSAALLMPVLFGNPLPFDFRRDLDRFAYLRSLPLKPFSIAIGQLFTAVVFFAVFEMLVLAGASLLSGAIPPAWLGAAAVLVLPVAWGAAAVENLLFLVLPYRVGPDGRAGGQFLGKALLLIFLKVIMIGVLFLVGFGAWWGVWLLTESRAAALAAAAVGMAVPSIPLTWLVGRTFARFDLTRDQPAT